MSDAVSFKIARRMEEVRQEAVLNEMVAIAYNALQLIAHGDVDAELIAKQALVRIADGATALRQSISSPDSENTK